MQTVFSIAAASAVSASMALAGPHDGVWDLGTCARMNDTVVTIAGDTIEFHESQCRLSGPVAVRDIAGATLYEMSCAGEGEVWRGRILLMSGYEDTLIRVEEGFAWTYRRCR